MAESSFAPAELDRLEDALEGLEHDGALERWLADEPSPAVRERLTSYRSVLASAREAMPMQEVRAGVLDEVLAEAHRAAAVAPAVVSAATGSWWQRMRASVWVPAVALAGTAVLVLWIGKPGDDDTLATTSNERAVSAHSADKEAPEFAKEEDAKPALSPAVKAEAPAAGEARPNDAPEADPNDRSASLEVDEQARSDAAEPQATPTDPSAAGALGSLGEAPGKDVDGKLPSGRPTSADPASGRWDLITAGDRARQAGNCVAARDEYAVALEDDDPGVRARAFAGLGLCDASTGESASADGNFERARELDGEIDAFIEGQREHRTPRKKSRKPKRKSALPSPTKGKQNSADQSGVSDQMDPFSP